MLGRILLAYGVVGRTFGAWLKPIGTFLLFLVLRAGVALFMALDHVLFPKLARARVARPILIVGNPRSGTTFLQRFLADQHVGSGLELWRMLYPSLTLQTLLKPLLPFLERVSPARHHSSAAHETSLTSVETDDASLLFRYFDGFFLYGFILAWDEEEHRALVDPDVRDTMARDARWLRKVWRRNLVATGGQRVLAKLFSATVRVPSFLAAFPDAKILYMVRDPLEVIPSGMSLVTGVLEGAFGFSRMPEDLRRRYLERLYGAFVDLFRRFHEQYTSGRIPADRVMIVRYDRMMGDFESLMDELLAFTETEASPELRAAIAAQGEKQRAYTSKHRYDLERFGLDAERIRHDCAFVYETFLT